MDHIYLFDVDGTLTEPRQLIDPDFGRFFERFCRTHPVYLVSRATAQNNYRQCERRFLLFCGRALGRRQDDLPDGS